MVCIWLILIVGFDCLGKINADPDLAKNGIPDADKPI